MSRSRILLLALCFSVRFILGKELPSGCDENLELKLRQSKQDTARVNLLVKISKCHFWSSTRTVSDLQIASMRALSAKTMSEELHYQKGLGDSYELLAMITHTQGDTLQGKKLALKAVHIFETNKLYLELGHAYFDLAGYYALYDPELSKRISLVEQSLAAYRLSGNKRKIADVLKELADIRNLKQDYPQALSELKEALKIYESINYHQVEGTYDLMGFVLTKLGDFEQALKYGLLAVRTAEVANDTTLQMATIYNRVGIIYRNLKDQERALKYFRKGMTIGIKQNDTQTVLYIAANISGCLLQMKKPEESLALLEDVSKKYHSNEITLKINIAAHLLSTYRDLKQYNNAQRYCDSVLALNARYDRRGFYQHVIYESVIEYFIETKQVTLAHKYIALSNELARSSHTPSLRAKNYLYQFRIDSIEGDYRSAILHYQQYKVLEDSLVNEAKTKKMEQLYVEFETDKKDQQIELLGKQNQLQQTQIERAEFSKKVTYGGIGLLSIILGLLIYHSRHRQRSHKQLQQQQLEIREQNVVLRNLVNEKDWLIKEIHHRVKNNFHIVIGLLGTQAQYLKNEEAMLAISESQHRIHAMSLIHQKLYQSENFSAINMPEYIYDLVEYLKASFETKLRIKFELQIERIELDLVHSLPIGLILNEGITNALKYAFPDNGDGIINISLRHDSETDISLIISDDGIGLCPDFETRKSKSMGINLMNGLTEDIGGTFSIKNNMGTQIHISFQYDVDTVSEPVAMHNT